MLRMKLNIGQAKGICKVRTLGELVVSGQAVQQSCSKTLPNTIFTLKERNE